MVPNVSMAVDVRTPEVEQVNQDSSASAHCRRVAALAMELSRVAGFPSSTPGLLRLCNLVDQQFESLQLEYKDTDSILDEIRTFAPFEGFDADLVEHFRRLRCRLPEQITRGEGLPVEAGTARHIFGALGQPREYEVQELAAVAVKDPVVAASLIRVANSCLFSPASRFSGAGPAIAYIGTLEARKVMLAAVLRPLFTSAGLMRLWHHSVSAAQFCSALSAKTERVGADEGLMLGLIHDFGALAVQFAPRESRDAYTRLVERGCPVTYVERLIFGRDHGEIGAEILSNWNFSGEMIEAVRFHHQPERSDAPLTAFIYLVEFWSGLDEDLPSFHRVEECLCRAGLTLEALAQTGTKNSALKTLRSLT